MKILNIIDFYENISDAIEAFSEESDRGVVLISASLIEDTLEEIIRNKLITPEKKNDELFDTPYAPLKTLSAKINFSYRVGLINKKTHSSFHQIREIRNEFAHGFLPVSFCASRDFPVFLRDPFGPSLPELLLFAALLLPLFFLGLLFLAFF